MALKFKCDNCQQDMIVLAHKIGDSVFNDDKQNRLACRVEKYYNRPYHNIIVQGGGFVV